ncbi:hypothetical protein [Methanosalsum natronophilum]|uniref:hypothetical protein n=1 Tax=Methanosalsum natronophilum TaxID=768733 RepID=UPI002168FB17|nr:hypothetical protein [Methanosalsum natronophilum]MCS3924849.1 hypothetical protein [Methanosalsum natronophilum]
MVNIKERFENLYDENETFRLFFTALVMIIPNNIAGIGGETIGNIGTALMLLVAGIIVFLVYHYSKIRREKKREALIPIGTPKRTEVKPHKGLITMVSKLSISSNSDYENELSTLYSTVDTAITEKRLDHAEAIRGTGHTIRSINHHIQGDGGLSVCWLLYTSEKSSEDNAKLIKHYIDSYSDGSIDVNLRKISDENDPKKIASEVNKIYSYELPQHLTEEDIISDITSGTKAATAAIILTCLSPKRDIQYIEQKEHDVIGINLDTNDIFIR